MKYTGNNRNLLALVIAGAAITITAAAIMTPLDAFATQSQSQSQASQGSDQSQRVGDTQPDRVGADDDAVTRDGPDDDDDDPDGKEANCWGEVTRDFAETGTLGQHSSNPPGDDD